MALSREQMFKNRVKVKEVKVEGFDDTIFIKELSGADIALVQTLHEEKVATAIIALSICEDDKGTLMCRNDDEEKSFVERMTAKEFTALSAKCLEVNGLGGTVEQKVKN